MQFGICNYSERISVTGLSEPLALKTTATFWQGDTKHKFLVKLPTLATGENLALQRSRRTALEHRRNVEPLSLCLQNRWTALVPELVLAFIESNLSSRSASEDGI